MKKWIEKFFDWWDDFLVYLFTFLGVMLSSYVTGFTNAAQLEFNVSYYRLIVGSVMALMLVLRDEELPPGDDLQRQLARRGKKQALRRRLSGAMNHGFSWSTLMSINPSAG